MSQSTQVDYILEMQPLLDRPPRAFPRIGDIVIAAAIGLFCIAAVTRLPRPGNRAVCDVYVDGKRVQVLSLCADTLAFDTLRLRTGRMILEYGRGRVAVRESACPRQVCVHAGAAGAGG